MADNVAITAGSGTTIATDQLGSGEHVQYMKIMDGTLDSTNKLIIDGNGAVKISSSKITASGTLTALNQAVTIPDAEQINKIKVAVSGTFVGSVRLEYSDDKGATFYRYNDASNFDVTAPETDIFAVPSIGHTHIRVRCNAYTSGSITVDCMAFEGPQLAGDLSTAITGSSLPGLFVSGVMVIAGQDPGGYAKTLAMSTLNEAYVKNNDVVITSPITAAAQTRVISTVGLSTANIQLSGTWVGTVQFEGTIDGTNWFSVNCVTNNTGAIVTSATANNNWQCDVAGFASLRIRTSAYTSGTITNTVRGNSGTGTVTLDAPLPAGANTIGAVNQSGTWNVTRSDNIGSGSLAALNAAVTVTTLNNAGSISAVVTGTFVGTWIMEGSADGTNWVAMDTVALPIQYNDWIAYGYTNAQTVLGNASGFSTVRVRAAAWTSGTMVVSVRVDGNLMPSAPPTTGGYKQGAIVANAATNRAASSDGQQTFVMVDGIGRLVTTTGQTRKLVGSATVTLTAATETTLIAAGGAGVFNDISSLVFSNSSATATTISLRDATAGTVRQIVNVAGGQTLTLELPITFPQAVANNNWTVQLGTAVTSVYVNVIFAKNVA